MTLTEKQRERYARNIALPEIGIKGQERLLAGRALVIGAGGLGSPAALYLAAAGVGTIGIADGDVVDRSNLQRQILHRTSDLGRLKVQSASEKLLALNPDCRVKVYPEFLDERTIRDVVRDYDVVLDATDNFRAKFLINDACVMENRPLVHAGILKFQGQIMTVIPHKSPCYRCVFGSMPPEDDAVKCSKAGVIGALPGVIGSLQAMEAVKYLTGAGRLLTGRLLTFDALTMTFHTVDLPPRGEGCAVCSDHPSISRPGSEPA